MRKGSCLCGAVRFTIEGELGSVAFCHCRMCRQWHGAPGAYAEARRVDVRFDAPDALQWYQSSSFARRGFCRHCGSSLFWERLGGPTLDVAIGALDEPTGLRAERHIFVAHKGDWYDIAEGLPQQAEGSPGAG
jgi:hypothetical protein